MARSIIIHIGRNKTGTSSIQATLAAGRKALEERGFLFPRPGHNQHFLADHLSRRKRRQFETEQLTTADAKAAALRQTIDETDGTVLLSSEALMHVHPRLLAEWLGPDAKVTIVAYIREQLDWLSSFYQQAVKARTTTAPIDAFAENYDPNYRWELQRLAKNFGQENLVVRIYDRERLVGGDVVLDFLSILGVDPAAVPPVSDDANPSIGGALLEAKRRINELGFAEAELRAATYVPLRELVTAHAEYRGKPVVPPAFAEAFRARYRESNAAVAERYFGGAPLFRLRDHAAVADFGEAEVAVAVERLVAAVEANEPAMAAEIRRRLAAAPLPAA